MTKFLSDIVLEGANDIQFKNTSGANTGKIESDGDDLVLSNAVGDILLGDGSSDVYIGDGTNSVDILFEVSGAISAESGAELTLGGAGGTLALGGAISLADYVSAISATGINTVDVGTSAKPFKNIYAAHHVGGSSINYATSRGWVEDAAPGGTQSGEFGGDFTINGIGDENAVVWGDDPFNNKALLWKCILNTSASDADGGWNKNIVIPANNNIGYLSYVYFKTDFTPDNANDGTVYLGGGQTTGQTLNLDGSNNTNPYSTSTSLHGTNNGGAVIANRWYVMVGIYQAYNNSTTDNDTVSGVYDVETGEKVQSGGEFKMGNNTTGQVHRAYVYYDASTDANENVYFWNPGFHAIDGSEPKIQDLVKRQVYLDDNVKAAFGTGNDLEIYHDASNSYIKDSGSGNLYTLTDAYRLTNAAGTENMIWAAENSFVKLYYDNSAKLETVTGGVDITGELQADSLDIDGYGTIIQSDSSGASPTSDDVLTIERNGSSYLNIIAKNTNYSGVLFSDDTRSAGNMLYNHSNDSMLFKTSGTIALTLDSSQNATFAGNVTAGSNSLTAGSLDINGNADISGDLTGVDTLTATTFSGDLNGTINTATTAATQSAGNNSTKVATTAYVDAQVATVVDSAPATLNTLNELAAALGDDASFSTTVTNSIAAKLPLAGGTMSGAIAMGSQNITGAGTITGTTLTGTPANASTHSLTLGRTDNSNYWNVNHAGNDFRLYNTASSGSHILFGVDSGGTVKANSVGIGTATPGQKLDVVGNIAVSGTVDGIDIATRDAILTSTTTTAGAALPKAGGTMSGAIAMGSQNITGGGTITGTTLTGTSLDINGNADISGTLVVNGFGYADTGLHVSADDNSTDLSTTTPTNVSLIVSNSDSAYGIHMGSYSSGKGVIQVRRTNAATYYDLDIQPHGGKTTFGGEVEAASLDINGNADISGDLTGVDTLTATTLSVTNYGLASGDIPNNAADTTGSAATLTTARTIAGVSFNGSANISLNNNEITNGAGYTGDQGKTDIDALEITTVGAISSGEWRGSVIASTYLKQRQTFDFKGYATHDGTNYEMAEIMTDTNAPFEHNTSTGANGTDAMAVSLLLRSAGQVMPYAGTVKKWKGWAAGSGSGATYIALFRYRPVVGSSSAVSPVLIDEQTLTVAGNNETVTIEQTTFTDGDIAAGDIIISMMKGVSAKTTYFTSTMEIEWD